MCPRQREADALRNRSNARRLDPGSVRYRRAAWRSPGRGPSADANHESLWRLSFGEPPLQAVPARFPDVPPGERASKDSAPWSTACSRCRDDFASLSFPALLRRPLRNQPSSPSSSDPSLPPQNCQGRRVPWRVITAPTLSWYSGYKGSDGFQKYRQIRRFSEPGKRAINSFLSVGKAPRSRGEGTRNADPSWRTERHGPLAHPQRDEGRTWS